MAENKPKEVLTPTKLTTYTAALGETATVVSDDTQYNAKPIEFKPKFDTKAISGFPGAAYDDKGNLILNSSDANTAATTTSGASNPGDLPNREINEYRIQPNRKLHGANIDVLETLDRINFSSSRYQEAHMGLNIAYLAYWKRGNIGTRATVDAPEGTDPVTGDKTAIDCQEGWQNCPGAPQGEGNFRIENNLPGLFTKYTSVGEQITTGVGYNDSGFFDPLTSIDFTSRAVDPLEAFNPSTNSTREQKRRSNEILLKTLSENNYETYFKVNGQTDIDNYDYYFDILVNYYEGDPNVDDAKRISDVARAYETLLVAMKDTAQVLNPGERIPGRTALRQMLENTNNLIRKNYEVPGEEFRPRPVSSDFEDIGLKIKDEIRILGSRLFNNFPQVINLGLNADYITDLLAIGKTEEETEILSNNVLSNLISPSTEQLQEIQEILETISLLQKDYNDSAANFGVVNLPVTPPEDNPNPGEVFSADPNDEIIYGPGQTMLDRLDPFYNPSQKNYDCQKKTTPVEGIWQFLYNPENLKYSISPQYAQASTWGNPQGSPVHWSGNDNEKLSFSKIILNGYMFGRKVETLIQGIRDLVKVVEGGSQQSPPVLEFIFGKKYFGPCVMENISITENMWDGGETVAAELSFDLRKIPDWIVNDGYVSIFDPTGQPVVTAPTRINTDPTPTEDAPAGDTETTEETAPGDSNSNKPDAKPDANNQQCKELQNFHSLIRKSLNEIAEVYLPLNENSTASGKYNRTAMLNTSKNQEKVGAAARSIYMAFYNAGAKQKLYKNKYIEKIYKENELIVNPLLDLFNKKKYRTVEEMRIIFYYAQRIDKNILDIYKKDAKCSDNIEYFRIGGPKPSSTGTQGVCKRLDNISYKNETAQDLLNLLGEIRRIIGGSADQRGGAVEKGTTLYAIERYTQGKEIEYRTFGIVRYIITGKNFEGRFRKCAGNDNNQFDFEGLTNEQKNAFRNYCRKIVEDIRANARKGLDCP